MAAGAVVDGRLVALAYTSAMTPHHADIAVVTDPDFRGRGLATASAALVIEEVHRRGAIPVWSTGEGNHASRRVAARLGLRPIGHRTYVIVDALPVEP